MARDTTSVLLVEFVSRIWIREKPEHKFMNDGRAILLAMTAISVGMAIVVYTFPGMLRARSTAGASTCADCPQMVLIPAGEFIMGSPGSELLRGLETQHRVTIPSFALGKYEVTFAQ